MIEQIGIACTSVIAIFLTQSGNANTRRYACLFGLAGQPFWLYAATESGQWGVLLVALLYTGAWTTGVYTNWIKSRGST